jgi:hypothetical protein
VDAACAGLHLYVIAVEDQGLLLAPESPSIFSLGTVAEFETGLTPERRMLTGLVLLCVAGVAYPSPADLERNAIVRVRVSQVERALRETAKVVAERHGEDEDDVPRAFAALGSVPTSTPGKKHNSKATSLGLIRNVLTRLVELGCARDVTGPSDDDPEFQLLDRFRHYVRERALAATNEALLATVTATITATTVENAATPQGDPQ